MYILYEFSYKTTRPTVSTVTISPLTHDGKLYTGIVRTWIILAANEPLFANRMRGAAGTFFCFLRAKAKKKQLAIWDENSTSSL